MGSPKKETKPLLSPNKASSVGTVFHPNWLLAKRATWKSPTTQSVAKNINCSPHTDRMAQLLKTTPTQLIEPGEV